MWLSGGKGLALVTTDERFSLEDAGHCLMCPLSSERGRLCGRDPAVMVAGQDEAPGLTFQYDMGRDCWV